ncbi:MAG: hypothetical protein AMXMBFR84_00630 [Candidatus Hydrogenedentota bacterium]
MRNHPSRLFAWMVLPGLLALCGCDPFQIAPRRAFAYLESAQNPADIKMQTIGFTSDYAGGWPQFLYFDFAPALRYRDVSPFTVAFIHHSLSLINEDTVEALGMTQHDAFRARQMRLQALAYMERFASRPDDPGVGTYGFWPYSADPNAPVSELERTAFQWLQGPVFRGSRTPPNVGFYPRAMAIAPDADTTACILAARLNGSLMDGGTLPPDSSCLHVLTDWRDTGQVMRRLNPSWLQDQSGLFLTWLDYRFPGDPFAENDVDLLVNANVLFAMARFGRLDLPGVSDAVSTINSIVEQGLHRTAFHTVSEYYPDNVAFEYCVSRAYHEGPVPDLQAAVERMADELVAEATLHPDGTTSWDRGAPALNTAFAVLTLMNAGRDTPVVEQGLAYLVRQQSLHHGSWSEGPFFKGQTTRGITVYWVSEAFTTAIALEAFCRFRLHEAGIG